MYNYLLIFVSKSPLTYFFFKFFYIIYHFKAFFKLYLNMQSKIRKKNVFKKKIKKIYSSIPIYLKIISFGVIKKNSILPAQALCLFEKNFT